MPLAVLPVPLAGVLADSVARAALDAQLGLHLLEHPAATNLPGDAAVLVAELPSGERRIPHVVLEAAAHGCGDARVLLLSHAPLVRPTITLQDGRVTLIGPPHSSERLAEQLRVLGHGERKRRAVPTAALGDRASDPSAPVVVREHLRGQYWIARVGGQIAQSVEPIPLPTLHEHALDGLIVFCGTPPGPRLSREQASAVVSLLRADGDHEQREQGFQAKLGPGHGVVHLNPAADTWTFYWPCADAPLWIYSELRLPSWWDLGAAMVARGTTLATLPAHAGDLVVGLSSWGPLTRSDVGHNRFLEEALSEGSPGMVDLLQHRLALLPQPYSAVIVEVR